MPEWKKEWLANLPRFVRMECGHGEDISIQTIVVKEFGTSELQVFCLPCDSLQKVTKRETLAEHLGIVAAVIPDEPLF
jgi:hypothetical protein